MHEDNFILLNGYLINLLLMYLLNRQQSGLFWRHLFVMLLYTPVMFYGLMYQSEGGSALVWWFYWLLIIIAHSAWMIYRLFRKTI